MCTYWFFLFCNHNINKKKENSSIQSLHTKRHFPLTKSTLLPKRNCYLEKSSYQYFLASSSKGFLTKSFPRKSNWQQWWSLMVAMFYYHLPFLFTLTCEQYYVIIMAWLLTTTLEGANALENTFILPCLLLAGYYHDCAKNFMLQPAVLWGPTGSAFSFPLFLKKIHTHKALKMNRIPSSRVRKFDLSSLTENKN